MLNVISNGQITRQMDAIDQNADEFSNLLIEENKRLRKIIATAAKDIQNLRVELVEQERINEELEREIAILKPLRKERVG